MKIEVYARPLGYMQITCPDCHRKTPKQRVPWRTGQWKCGGKGCRHRFRLGVGFNTTQQPAMAFGQYNGETANLINPAGIANKAHYSGLFQWRCPICHTNQEEQKVAESVECIACEQKYYISLLMYKGKNYVSHTPYDWILPHAEFYKERLAAETISEGSGEDSRL